MALGPLVTDKIEALIAKVYKDHPKWKAPKVREEVIYLVHRSDPKLPPQWPGLSIIQKVLAKARKPHPDPQDKPWSIATLDQYPIPPGALPVVLRTYKRHIEDGGGFTIRQAKWVSRLSATEWAETSVPDQIAKTEQLYEIIGRTPDLEVYDKLLAGLKAEANDLVPLFASASLAGILKDETLRIPKGEKGGKPQ
jgi:hypothetical protein